MRFGRITSTVADRVLACASSIEETRQEAFEVEHEAQAVMIRRTCVSIRQQVNVLEIILSIWLNCPIVEGMMHIHCNVAN